MASACLLSRGISEAGAGRAVVNLQSVAAVVFLAAIISFLPRPALSKANRTGAWLIALVCVPFLITLRCPFLFDSYTHLVDASRESGQQVIRFFYAHPVSGDFFFRPLGSLDYWLEAKWAGFQPVRWRADGIGLHLLATVLVMVLCRAVSLSPGAAVFGALVFGLHGSNPEVVAWTAARFDELATVFVLVALLLLCRYVDTGKRYTPMILACFGAMLSKEAAFCLPGLAVCTLAYRGRAANRRSARALAGMVLAAAVALVYRMWVLGGVGGYQDAAGAATALQFNLTHAAELFLFRMWGVLLFPVNWSEQWEWWLAAAFVVCVSGCATCMYWGAADGRKVGAALAFCTVALLPASHLALLDSSMLGSRVYHLALIGLALLFGALYEGLDQRKWADAIAVSLILFQAAALSHNLLIWRKTAEMAGRVCQDLGTRAADRETVVLTDLPRSRQGVYFLSNGFSDCVFVNSGKWIKVDSQKSSGAGRVIRWDEAAQGLVEEGTK